jgi:hypothetical protein
MLNFRIAVVVFIRKHSLDIVITAENFIYLIWPKF